MEDLYYHKPLNMYFIILSEYENSINKCTGFFAREIKFDEETEETFATDKFCLGEKAKLQEAISTGLVQIISEQEQASWPIWKQNLLNSARYISGIRFDSDKSREEVLKQQNAMLGKEFANLAS